MALEFVAEQAVPQPDGTRRLDDAVVEAALLKKTLALRQVRRRALQPHLGLYQKPARFRSGWRIVLAGADAGGG